MAGFLCFNGYSYSFDTIIFMLVKKIILDTEVFIRLKNDFNHTQLSRLKSLPKYEVYSLAITDVTQKEIEIKIKDQIEESFQSLRKIQSNPLVHRAYDLSYFNLDSTKSAYEKAMNEFSSFLIEFDIEVISSKEVKIWEVLDKYFTVKPPFSQKKKDEFPDAISLISIHKHLAGSRAIVVSGDKDWKDYFQEMEAVEFYESIPELLENKLARENKLISTFKNQIKLELDDIQKLIANKLVGSTVDAQGFPLFEVKTEQIENIDVEDINVIEIKKGGYSSNCIVSLEVDISLNLVGVRSLRAKQNESAGINTSVIQNIRFYVVLNFSIEDLKQQKVLACVSIIEFMQL